MSKFSMPNFRKGETYQLFTASETLELLEKLRSIERTISTLYSPLSANEQSKRIRQVRADLGAVLKAIK